MSEQSTILPTADGGHVLIYVDHLTAMFGVYGLRVNSVGDIEGLVIGPDGAEWKELSELSTVQAGTPRPAKPRRS